MVPRSLAPASYLFVLLCVVAAPLAAWAQVSDDFSGSDTITAQWLLVDPVGDSDWAAYNGWLNLSVPGGTGHDLREGVNRTARLLQDVADDDFEVEAKFQSLPAEDFQVQGLMVETDPTHYLHLDVRRAGPSLKVACVSVTGGVTNIRGEVDFTGQGPIWLRLSRLGNEWRGSVSADGLAWDEVFQFEHGMKVSRMGIFGGNAGTGGEEDTDLERDDPVTDKSAGREPSPAFEVQVDYFFDTATPVDPEDGDLQNGVRITDNLLALYCFTEGVGDIVLDHAPVLPKLDLKIADTATMDWLPEGGVDLTAATLMDAPGPAEKINSACRASNEVTIEAWLHPATTAQSGPARIVTVSKDPSYRNVSLAHGQWGSLPKNVYDVRLRTSTTSLNGQPETVSPAGSLTSDLQHVVFTYDETGQTRIYVDGVVTVTEAIGGDLDNWDDTYRFGIGAEMDGSRFWLGQVLLTAIYDVALAPDDVAFNYRAGPHGGFINNLPPAVALSGITPGESFRFDDPLTLNAVAADANGNLVRVDFYAGDVLLSSDAVAPYEFTWLDPAVGSHLIKAVAVDDEGSQTSSEVIPILVTVSSSFESALFVSDDFSDADLDLPWVVADGTTGSDLDQAGGHLTVDVPSVTQDPWTSSSQEVFAYQPENDVDLALELKLAATDFSGDSFGGLRFEGGGGEILQLLGEYAGAVWTVSWGSSNGGVFTDLGSLAVSGVTEGLWLQVRRESDAWSCFYSTNGLIWLPAASLTRSMVLSRSGLVAGGLDTAAGTQTAAFDYAFDLAGPIIPEDGGSGGDLTGPVIGDISMVTELGSVVLGWETDEPAYFRFDYGTTTAYELGTQQGGTYLISYEVELNGLADGEQFHFLVTCVDTVGNISTTGDMLFFTDAEAVLSPGPDAGDVYREVNKAIRGTDNWRVTDPDATNPGAADFLPNPVLTVQVPDLTGAVRAEIIIDRWGGHPGTTNKRLRLAGRSWLHLPELASIPGTNPECYMYQDNLMIDVPLNQLEAGTMTLEGTAGGQICNSFGWGQWGWYGLILRVYYDGTAAHPTGTILSPAVGDTIIDTATISVSASSAGTVEEVHVLGWYEGIDADGDGVFTDWHREYHRTVNETSVTPEGMVARFTSAPWSGTWDVEWIPDQQPGSVKLQARILDDSGLWCVTDLVDDLSLRHSDGVVRLHTMDNVPRSYWVRTNNSITAEFTIPAEDDLTTATGARMMTPTWNGANAGVVDVNGLWQASGFGTHYFYMMDTFSLPVSSLVQGENEVTISAATSEHGMEMLWPGPMFLVRYGSPGTTVAASPGSGDLNNDGRVDTNDAMMVLDHLVGAASLTPHQIAAGDLSGDGQLNSWDAALIAGADPAKASPSVGSPAWGEAQGQFGQLTLPVESVGGPAHSLWLEVTAPGLEDMVRDVSPALQDAGLFRWRVSGDKLCVAFAASAVPDWPDRVLEIVLDVSGEDPGRTLSGVLAVDGGEPVRLSDTPLTAVPVRFRLGDNYPNPFNPSTKISFDLPVSGRVNLRIHDVRGRVVRTLVAEEMSFGSHTLVWGGVDDRGRAVPSGVYFYRIETPGFGATRKMLLLK